MAETELIIQMSEKNNTFIGLIREKLMEVADILVSIRGSVSLLNSRSIESLSMFLFLNASYKVGHSSPGEEYLKIKLSGKFTFLYILYHCFVLVVVRQIQKILKYRLFNLNLAKLKKNSPFTLCLVETAQFGFTLLENSDFFGNLPDIAGIVYTFISGKYSVFFRKAVLGKKQTIFDQEAFFIMGCLMAFSYGIDVLSFFLKVKAEFQRKKSLAVRESSENIKFKGRRENLAVGECALCLEKIQNLTALKCGHLFCWECISEYTQITPVCPLCKAEAKPQHCLRLKCNV